MRVLIAGAGEVGFRVGRDLVFRGHEVTMIDSSTAAVKRAQTLDAQVFQGNAAVSYTHLTLPTKRIV